MGAKAALLAGLAVLAAAFLIFWSARGRSGSSRRPTPATLAIGFVTDFFDTLGIGSFATTTTAFRLLKVTDDRLIPGTLNVGHALPTIAQAFIYVTLVQVDATTLLSMIGAAVIGAFFGSGFVAQLPRRRIRLAMGAALGIAAVIMASTALEILPKGSDALGLSGLPLAAGIAGNLVLGMLMTLGVGLYAPCMILVSLLGMNPTAAFPIMMGSCAFLMPVAGARFVSGEHYDARAAVGLTLGGIPAVLIAAFLVRSLPLGAVRWLVIVVALYTSVTLVLAARRERREPSA